MQFSLGLTKQTLTVFLGGILAKRYTNPSADIITVLAGLNEVDTVFTDFANGIESTIRTGRSCERSLLSFPRVTADSTPVAARQKAIAVAIALTSGAYQTSLVSYFTHRDLFPSLMKVSTTCSLLILCLREPPSYAGCSLDVICVSVYSH